MALSVAPELPPSAKTFIIISWASGATPEKRTSPSWLWTKPATVPETWVPWLLPLLRTFTSPLMISPV